MSDIITLYHGSIADFDAIDLKGAPIMELTENTPHLCADLVLTRVAERYAKENNLTNTQALKNIMETKTYELLENPASMLCYETAESIYALLEDEQRGDWNEWMKI